MDLAGSNNASDHNNHTVTLPPAAELSFVFEFLLPGVCLNAVGLLGLVGNLISIFILSRPQMKGSTNCILIGLATYDIILIISRYDYGFCFSSMYSRDDYTCGRG